MDCAESETQSKFYYDKAVELVPQKMFVLRDYFNTRFLF